MRIASQNTADIDFGRFDLGHECAHADLFSAMWTYVEPEETSPYYGPRMVGRTLDKAEVLGETVFLVDIAREVCLFDLQAAQPAIPVRRLDPREETLQRIADRFRLRGRESVCRFLKDHWFLVSILFEARKRFDQYFGADARAALELITDPEDDSSTTKLFALILTSLSSNDASTRLDRLDEEWWFNQPPDVRRVLSIDVDYVDGV
ncbi:MAG TPA: hypothetical protein VJV03_15055 [Pyrinomonadaceae bacterium]|nr:hypothetical protein [Pyrinomonadaceae bacterium]